MYPRLTTPLLLFGFFCTALASCSKPGEEQKKENKPPGNFTVSVSNVTSTSAALAWTAATDPENEAVTYAVEVNSQGKASGLSATNYQLGTLQKNTAYSGKVTATDASGHSTSASFSLNTSDSPAPSAFTVKTDASTNKSVTISWTAATLPNNEPVTYDVFEGTALKASNLTQLQFQLNGLLPATAYSLKVVAKSADGKSTEKSWSVQTGANSAPTAVTAQELEHGFSYVKLKWTAATDADNDSISYFLKRDGITTALTVAPVGGVYTYVAKTLLPSTAYNFSIVAKDGYGGEVNSNALTTTTNAGPESNFTFTTKNSGSDVLVEWTQNYATQFDVSGSSYFINGVEKNLSGVQVDMLPLGNGTIYVKTYLKATDFPDNVERSVKFKLGWGANEGTTQSRQQNHTRYTFSSTSASVSSAVLKTFSNGIRGYVLNFAGDKISDYTTWNVVEVKFADGLQPNGITIQFPAGQLVGSVYGDLSEADYQFLKTKSDGFIIVKDDGGYHRMNFTYTVQ